MTYASEKLNREVIRHMRGRLIKIISASQMIPHLPCLTDSDREEIMARRQADGNQLAVMMLLDNLVRRENWPEHFIAALRECDQQSMANEIQDAYDKIRGIRRQASASASPPSTPVRSTTDTVTPETSPAPALPTTAAAAAAAAAPVQPAVAISAVTTASTQDSPHFNPHPVPAARALINSPLPNVDVPVQPSVLVFAPEATALPPPKPAHSADPPLSDISTHARPKSQDSAPKVTASPEHHELPASFTATSILDPPSNPMLKDLSGQFSADEPAVSANTVTTSDAHLNKPSTTSLVIAVEESKTPVALRSFNSVKHPIQDTNPVIERPVLAQDSHNNSRILQMVEREPSAVQANGQNQASSSETTQISSSAPFAGRLRRNTAEPPECTECLSKPGILRADEPLSVTSSDLEISHFPAGSSPVQPAMSIECSVNTADLMISRSTTEHVSDPTAQRNVAGNSSLGASANMNNDSSLTNTASFTMEPVEDHYESGILVNIGQYSEMPSRQDLYDQPPTMTGNMSCTNDKQAGLHQRGLNHLSHSEMTEDQAIEHNQSMKTDNFVASGQTGPAYAVNSPRQKKELNESGQINHPESDKVKESQEVLSRLLSDPLILAAAALCVVAIFLAWKNK